MSKFKIVCNSLVFMILFSVISTNFSFSMDNQEHLKEDLNTKKRKGFFPHIKYKDESNINNNINHIKFDEERKLYYFGENLTSIPFKRKSESDTENELKISFVLKKKTEEIIEDKKQKTEEIKDSLQRLLLANDSINDIFEDINLLKKYEGLLTKNKDRRTEVLNTEDAPWNAHGSMIMSFSDNSQYIGSGTLIGKRAVITAGHNLYDRKTKRAVESVTFYPGRNKNSIYAKGIGTKFLIHPNWKKEDSLNSEKSDIGLVILDEDFQEVNFKEGEEKLCFFGYDTIKIDDLVPQNDNPIQSPKFINITGYPGAAIIQNRIKILNGESMLTMKGKANKIEDGRIFYDIDTSPANSGSGIWLYDKEDFICCGVHTNGGDKLEGNTGIFLNEEKCKIIDYWLESEEKEKKK